MEVVSPRSTQEASRLLGESAKVVMVRGAGTKRDWGLPARGVELTVETKQLNGIAEHAAGDLIVVVRAGTPMAQLQSELAKAGQQLALDTPDPQATVGGTVAVNTSGPRRMLYGTVRDLLIGVTVVRPDGVIARAGGKVVKNVAGYDLGKLYTGSYGTLGLITECAFRLHPLPAAVWYLRCRPTDPVAAAALIRQSQLVPSAIEVDAPPSGDTELAILFEGTADGARARAEAAQALVGGEITPDPPPWWGLYPWRSGDIGVKLTAALSQQATLLALRAKHPAHLRGSLGTGVLYAALPTAAANTDPALPAAGATADPALPAAGATADPALPAAGASVDAAVRAEADARVQGMRAAAQAAGGHAVVLIAPPQVRDGIDMWGPVAGLALMRRVKEQFDPRGRFAPGCFVGGI